MPYFSYTRLNIHLDLIFYSSLITLLQKRQIAQFVQRNFANSREFAHFQFFLNPHLGFENFENFENMFVCTNKNPFLMNFAR